MLVSNVAVELELAAFPMNMFPSSKFGVAFVLPAPETNIAPIKTPTKLASVKHSSDFGIVSI